MYPDIVLFAEVVRTGSLSAAGRSMGISPAMVSKRIARLEARLGVRLLNRTTRRLDLTARGAAYHRDMVEILAAIRDAEARVSDRTDTPAGPLRVSAPTSFGRLHIAPHLKPFLDAHPAIELDLDLSDGFSDVIGDRLDLAIRIAPAVPPSLTGHRLADSRRVLCAAPSYSAPRGAADLTEHRLLAAKGQMPWRLAGADGDVTIDRPSYVATNSSEVVSELTLAGVGIALRSLWDVSADLSSGRLVRILPELAGPADVGIYAVHARGPVSSGTAALLDYLRGLWSPMPPWES